MEMELFDEDLKEVMGGMYDDGDTPRKMPVMEQKAKVNADKPVAKNEYITHPNERRGVLYKLKSCCLWLLVCGGISMLMWWFWANNLMATEAAYLTIWLSSIIGAAGAGRSSK